MADTFTEEQIVELTKQFKDFDTDDNQLLSFDELNELMLKNQYSEEKLSKEDFNDRFNNVQTDADGNIDFDNFLTLVASVNNPGAVPETDAVPVPETDAVPVPETDAVPETDDDVLVKFFRSIDSDFSGFIEHNELKKLLMNNSYLDITDEEVNDIIASIDIDGDGQVNLEELHKLLLPK